VSLRTILFLYRHKRACKRLQRIVEAQRLSFEANRTAVPTGKPIRVTTRATGTARAASSPSIASGRQWQRWPPTARAPEAGDVRVSVTFYPPDRRGDRVNFANRMKPYFDGIADASRSTIAASSPPITSPSRASRGRSSWRSADGLLRLRSRLPVQAGNGRRR
jgi:hypothetical protein